MTDKELLIKRLTRKADAWDFLHPHATRPNVCRDAANALMTQSNLERLLEILQSAPPVAQPMPDAEYQQITTEQVYAAMHAISQASCGEIQPTFEEMKAALEAALSTYGKSDCHGQDWTERDGEYLK